MAGRPVRRLLLPVACLLLGWVATCAEVPQQSGTSLGRRFGGGRTGGGSLAAAPPGLVLHGRRYPVRLRYTACTGLVNQQYSHIAAFTLAAALGVHEVLLPPAAVRDSFGHVFSIHQSENQMQWFPARPSCLLDVERLQRTWAGLGLTVTEPATLLPFPDLMFPAGAFQLTPLPGLDPRAVVRVDGIYMSGLELPQLATAVREAAEAHVARMAAAFPGLQLGELLLDLPCTFFSLNTTNILPVVSQVAATLHFNPSLEYLADRVVSYITRDGRRNFNGAHLRVEKDAAEWFLILGGLDGAQVVWEMYRDAMLDAGFEPDTPLFVATGLLSYGAHYDFTSGVSLLVSSRLCSEVLYKELYLPPFELQRLNSEQLALLDFLILARAHKFVGFGPSTFSTYLKEHRTLHGRPPSLSILISAPRIGTDEAFARSAHITAVPQQDSGEGSSAGGQQGGDVASDAGGQQDRQLGGAAATAAS